METLQSSSIKIKKKSRNTTLGERNYMCGGCKKAYKSYPALYLHIKRMHNGIRPLNTKTTKPMAPVSKDKIHTGRPQKPSHDVDGVSESQAYLENAQSELLGFLGERLNVVTVMDAKPKFESVVNNVIGFTKEIEDESMGQLKIKTEELLQEMKRLPLQTFDIELDFDDYKNLNSGDGLYVLVWFLLWMGKYIIKTEFLREFTIIVGKIWKVLTQKQLQISDLDNKLVWNGIMKECDPLLNNFECFDKKKELLNEFVSKTCHLIGKIFEEN